MHFVEKKVKKKIVLKLHYQLFKQNKCNMKKIKILK